MELEQGHIADSDKLFLEYRAHAESLLESLIAAHRAFLDSVHEVIVSACATEEPAVAEKLCDRVGDQDDATLAILGIDSEANHVADEVKTELNRVHEDFRSSMIRHIRDSVAEERQRLHEKGREKILYIVNFSQLQKASIDEWAVHNEDDYFASKNKTFDTSLLALNCDALQLASVQGSTSRSSDSRSSRKGSSRSSRGQLSSRKLTASKTSARQSASRGPSTSRSIKL